MIEDAFEAAVSIALYSRDMTISIPDDSYPRRAVEGTVALGAAGGPICLEWAERSGLPPMILLAPDGESGRWSTFAARMAHEFRVLAFAPGQAGPLARFISGFDEPAVVIAQGSAGESACAAAAALAAPMAVLALVLADYSPDSGATTHTRLNEPVLVIRGRQGTMLSHENAVALHESIPGSHLIEPEDCSDWPAHSCPDAFETAVRWFLSEIGQPYMEFEMGEEPLDPRRTPP